MRMAIRLIPEAFFLRNGLDDQTNTKQGVSYEARHPAFLFYYSSSNAPV